MKQQQQTERDGEKSGVYHNNKVECVAAVKGKLLFSVFRIRVFTTIQMHENGQTCIRITSQCSLLHQDSNFFIFRNRYIEILYKYYYYTIIIVKSKDIYISLHERSCIDLEKRRRRKKQLDYIKCLVSFLTCQGSESKRRNLFIIFA